MTTDNDKILLGIFRSWRLVPQGDELAECPHCESLLIVNSDDVNQHDNGSCLWCDDLPELRSTLIIFVQEEILPRLGVARFVPEKEDPAYD